MAVPVPPPPPSRALQRENVPKLPNVLRLLLRKPGHWPVHEIKSFAIGTFLSSLLLKEQMMISEKKKKNLCETIPSPNEIAKQAGVLSTKWPGLKRQHFEVVGVSVVVIAQANVHHFPPPQKWAKLPFCFIKNVRGIRAKPIAL